MPIPLRPVKKNEHEAPVRRIGGGSAKHLAALSHLAGGSPGALDSVVYF